MDKAMWKVLEKVLEPTELWSLLEANINKQPDWLRLTELTPTYQKIFDIVSEHYDLSTCIGVEQWTNRPGLTFYPEEHIDKDEGLWREKKELGLPLCSAIVYMQIENLEGANLEVTTETTERADIVPPFDTKEVIVPKQGNIVLLSPGVWHRVTDHVAGKRFTLILNFWDKPLYCS